MQRLFVPLLLVLAVLLPLLSGAPLLPSCATAILVPRLRKSVTDPCSTSTPTASSWRFASSSSFGPSSFSIVSTLPEHSSGTARGTATKCPNAGMMES